MRTIVIFLGLAAAVCGCTSWQKQSQVAMLPEDQTVLLDQLVVHCNFELPGHHRLLEELNAQRTDVSNKLALPVSDEPIHVFLFQNEDRFGDFIHEQYPEFPSRRAFFVETDTRLLVYAHWGDRVAEDLRHEVCHGYLHSIVPRLPLWLDEGLAEYFEVPRGNRGLNAPHVDELVALSSEGKWQPDLVRLERLESPGEMNQLDYAESWAWVHMLLETAPANREMLQSYLSTLRRDGAIEPLSLWIRQLQIEPQRTLVDHLTGLKSRPPRL